MGLIDINFFNPEKLLNIIPKSVIIKTLSYYVLIIYDFIVINKERLKWKNDLKQLKELVC